MTKSILILGSDGFIGSNCTGYFQSKGYDIYPTTNSKSQYNMYGWEKTHFFGDLREEKVVKYLFQSLKEKEIDVVIQAAATTTGSKDVIEKPYLHVTDNAVMNSWIFREAMLAGVKHVIFPSCTVMYKPMDKHQSEDDWNPSDEIYPSYFGVGNTKVYLEKMCDFYSRLGKTKFTAIRHSNVYGPGDKFDLDRCHVLPALVNKIISNDELEIWGSGEARRDLLYIDDLIEFIDLCIQKQENRYELFNCGVGNAVSIIDLAHKIMDVADKHIPIKMNASKPDIPTTVILDCEKAKKLLGWEPKTSLEDGLKKTIEHFRSINK